MQGTQENLLQQPRSPSYADLVDGYVQKRRKSFQDSAYKDDFDWDIYKNLAIRTNKNKPPGGVIFKTALKLVNSHPSCAKCHYSFEIDSYGRGCVHDCVYCYAKDQLTRRGYWNKPMPFPVDLAEIRHIFYTVFETDKPNKWKEILLKRIPLRIGSMSDSFMWIERKYGVTRQLLKLLNFYKYPHIIFTRSDLIAADEYINILDRDFAAVQFSISGNNEIMTKQLEPRAPSVSRRLAALKKLNEAKIWTTTRINPLFPIYPDGYFTNREAVLERFPKHIPSFPFFSLDLISEIKESKCGSILAGFVRLSDFVAKAIHRATGVDVSKFFDPNLSKQKHFRYSDKEIAQYYKMIKSECDRHNIRFSTCYIGNGEKDYYQYQNLWSNLSDCCDAKGNVKTFRSSCQEILNPKVGKSILASSPLCIKSMKCETKAQEISNG